MKFGSCLAKHKNTYIRYADTNLRFFNTYNTLIALFRYNTH